MVVVDQERPHLHPGDVLVAENVGPDWPPLFSMIGALVLDEGVLSQHAGIVAREYGIPAVMNTKEATKAIRNGQRVVVDASAGEVRLYRPSATASCPQWHRCSSRTRGRSRQDR